MSHQDQEARLSRLSAALDEANATLCAKLDELSLVRRVGDAISSITSVAELSKELVIAISQTVDCRLAAIYSGDPAAPLALQAVSEDFGSGIVLPQTIADTTIARVLGCRHAVLRIEDASVHAAADPAAWPFPPQLRSWLFVPLVEDRNLRGIVCLADDPPQAFNEQTERTLMVVVPQIANAVAKIGLYDGVRASEVKYRTLVESMHDVVFITDRNWRIQSVNPAGIALFGNSIEGAPLPSLFGSRDDATEFLAKMSANGSVQNFEAELKTGSETCATALIGCVASDTGYSGVIKDVTESARLVEQVVRAQKMESVGTLAAGVAHDFNNILGIIMPNAELIQLRAPQDPGVARHADVIIKASKRAHKLTKQLLSLARRGPRQVRTMNLNESIRTTCALFEDTIGQRISVDLRFESNPMNISADDCQVEQILLNLAINARDAMPDGGSLTFETKRDGGSVLLRVGDTGTGIAKDLLPNIFDPFFTTKDKSRGSGLGLSVVYSLVKQMGGAIDVHSELGAGTEFQLRFPALDDVPQPSALLRGQPASCGERILIVDDEPEIRSLLETVLKGIGYSVVSAANGLDAVDRVSDEFQLVIMDMMMPVMDGITAVAEIRRKLPHMKILVASGYTTPENIPALQKLKIDGFVHKPFELHKLAHLVRDVLDGVAA